MAAIVAGNSLGLSNTSLFILGAQGALGSAAQGRAGERVYVNTATGNLVVQNRDELVLGRGPDLSLVRTYNSRGLLNDDNGDNWRLGIYRRVFGLTGTANTAGSTITRTDADGADAVYTYSTSLGKYVTTEGEGAYDTLAYDSATQTWTFTDGDSRVTERYDGANNGRITQVQDADGNSLTFTYVNGLITQVSDASGETTFLEYSGNNLTQLRTVKSSVNGDGQTIIRTKYLYDGANRLTQVITDLTPENTTDANTYVVNYTYDGTSKRIASLTQTDGNNLSFTYALIGGDWKVTSYTDANGKTTSITYTQQDTSPATIATANNTVLSTSETQTTTVAAYYTVTSTDTWTSITQAVYGTSNANAIAALQTALNNPALSAGLRLTVPPAITYNVSTTSNANSAVLSTTVTTTTTVAPYYTVQAGNTWASITQTVYGTSDANAVAALQAALGNPALTAGLRLTVPQSLSYNPVVTSSANNPLLATTVTTTSNVNLNTSALTTPASWQASATLVAPTSGTVAATVPQIKYDQNGNGMSVWVVGADLFYSTYSKANDTWSVAATLDGTLTGNPGAPQLSMSANGNALVTWLQNGNVYARRYIAGAWDGATTIANLENLATAAFNPVGAINDSGRAVVAFLQPASSSAFNSLYANVYNGTAWQTAATLVDNVGAVANNSISVGTVPSVAIDGLNNATVLWSRKTGAETVESLYFSRFSGSTWSAPNSTLLESTTTAVTQPRIAFDANGNGVAIWVQGGAVMAKSYTRATDAWSAAATLGPANGTTQLSISANGNALATWDYGGLIYARRYAAGAWLGSAAELISDGINSTFVPAGAINDAGQAAVVFVMFTGDEFGFFYDLVARRFANGAWQAQTSIESNANVVSTAQPPSVAIDPSGNVGAVWLQSNGTLDSVYRNRFSAAGTPFYTIPSGATWASIAQALYGSSAAGGALQTAMGNPPLVAGNQLTGFPPTLTVTTTTTVAPYYTVQSGDTWASITLAVYGTNTANAVAALQAALGNPALTVGARLTVPQTLSYAGATTTAGANNAVLSTTIATTTTVAPYYTVTSTDTWASITQTVYGTSNANAVAALQAALGNPVLSTGLRLTVPSTLSYNVATTSNANSAVLSTTNTATVTVAPYYNVQANSTWVSITQAVYGTSNASAVAALQTATANPTLTAGLHLTVPQTLTYYATVPVTVSAEITDPLGLKTSLFYDGKGQITRALSPAIGATALETRYAYDASGNVTQVIDGRGNVVAFEYDANGNRTLERDAAGNTVKRTYGSKNELLTETTYLVPDPDGAGVGQPATPLTTRYVYDVENHLRFVVSGEGRVTEYRYSDFGEQAAAIQYTGTLYSLTGLAPDAALTETQLNTWVSTADKAKTLRTDSTYDFRGQLASTKTYTSVDATGAGVLNGTEAVRQYIYDQAGNLLKTVDPRGTATALAGDFETTYVYDGLGRVLSTTDATGRTTLTQYQDANRKTVLTLANGLVSTSTYDATGNLVSVLQSANSLSLGETKYFYDADGRLRRAEDPTGIKTHILYDEAGRKVATIDGDGSLTEYRYDAASNLTRTLRYATAVSSVNLNSLTDATGKPTTVALAAIRPASTAADQSAWNAYDAANRLVKSIDEAGAVTQYFYDGADRLTDAVRFATLVDKTLLGDSPAATSASTSPASNAADRLSRSFYDAEGRLRGSLDGEGYLVEYKYDAAGQLVETVGYATATSAALRAAGTLAQLVPATSANDIHSYVLYNARGQTAGAVDAEGYLTESVYDVAGNKTQVIRYATKVTYTAGATLASLRPAANVQDQSSSFVYDALNRVTSATNPEGTQTQYFYDEVGNLTKTVRAANTAEVRTLLAQYDKQGRLTAELSAKGAAQLTGSQTQAQIDAIWAANAIKHTYDAAGRRTSTTDANGRRTLFFYNADGALTHTINALGEVKESVYNALGQVTQTIEYGTRISSTTLATLSGGLNSTLTGVTANVLLDSKTSYAYTLTGALAQKTDPLGNAVTQAFNAFGETVSSSQSLGAGLTLDRIYTYDKRGLLTSTAWDPSGLNTSGATVYDAFGRAVQSTDANGNVRSATYDRLGRTVASTDAFGQASRVSYDAFDRVLTQTDAVGKITSYSYNTASRSVTVTTPENIATTTMRNRHGETISVIDGRNNTTTYTYDANGNVIRIDAPSGRSTTSAYDNANLLIETTDANGVKTAYGYDAANRVLTRTVDPGAGRLNLTTTYAYDAKGQTISVTDPAGVVTQTQFDLKGQVSSVIVDAGAGRLNLTTTYTYDGRGKTLKVTEGAGSASPRVTEYAYDKLGRRTSERLDPAGINATTTYAYDKNDNVIRKTDALGNVTRYTYDKNDRLVHTVDALGGVTKNEYDANGRLTRFTAYATPINLTNLTDASTLDDIGGRIVASANDQTRGYVYDGDGRELYCIDSLGVVTQKTYDANGNLVRKLEYGNAIASTTALTQAAVAAALVPSSANDRLTRTVYDAANRAIYTVDAAGFVTQFFYDANGNAIKQIAYATAVTATFADNTPPTVVTSANDRTTRSAYDAAGRRTFAIDAQGYVTQTFYDASGNAVKSIAYATAVTAAFADGTPPPVVTSAGDRTTRSVYDAAGRTRYSVDAEGYVTERRLDALGQETSRIRYADKVTVSDGATLASMAAMLPATVPASAVQEQARYDAAGRLFETVDGEGVVTRNLYNALGLKTDVVGAYGTSAAVTTHYSYNALGQAVEETRAFGTADAASTRYVLDAFGQRIRIIDPRGVNLAERDTAWAQAERVRLGFSAQAASLTSLQREQLLARYTSTQTFDRAGRVTSTTDALGTTTRTVYDAHGNAIKITDPRGASGYFYFGANDKARFHVDPLGFVTEYRYDAFGNVTTEVRYANALSGAYNETTAADALALMLTASADDRQTTKAYDRLGQVTTITYQGSPTSYTETFVYDAFGNKTQYKDKNDAVFNYEYDRRGLVTRELSPETDVVTAVVPSVVTQRTRLTKVYEYDAFGNRTRMLEAFGLPQQRETRYFYDRLGRETRVEAPSFSVFDRASGTSTVRAPANVKTYDVAGNLVMETAPNGGRVLNYYDAASRKVAAVDAENVLREYEYDAVGNLIRERTYDTRLTGTLSWQTRPAPLNPDAYREMRYSYNANNLRTGTETRTETLFSYALLQSTGQGYYDAPVRTSTEYNANGDAVRIVDGNGNNTYQFYDAAGNRILQVDPLGYAIRWEYTSQGEVARETRYASALPAATLATLTVGTNPQSLIGAIPGASTNPDNRVTEYTYDRLGRVTLERKKAVAYATVNATTGQMTEQLGDLDTRYEYDGNGKVKALILPNAQGRTDFAYDALGHQTQELKPQFQAFNGRGQALVATREETRWAYDAYGNIAVQTQLALSAAENRETRSQYDSAGNLRTEVDPVGATISYDYDIARNVLRASRQVTDVDGVNHTYRKYYVYDLSKREVSCQEIDDEGTASQVILPTEDTRYNAHGDIEAKGTNGQFQEQYKYDRLGHLFWTNKENGTPRLYLYDANGNAVLEVHAINTDLGTVNGPTGPKAVTSPADVRLFSPVDVQFTVSFYDARNQITSVFQPPMEFASLIAMAPVISTTGTNAAPAETLTNLSAYTPVASSQMTKLSGATRPAGTPATTVMSDTTTTATGYADANAGPPPAPLPTFQTLAIPLAELGLTAGTTVQPTVVVADTPVTVISADGTTKTVTERVTKTTVTTEVTVQADNAVLKKVTTTVDVINRVTTFTKQITDSYSTTAESLSTQWVLEKDETLNVDRRVDVKQDRISRVKETSSSASYVGTAATYAGRLAYSPPGYVAGHRDLEMVWSVDENGNGSWVWNGRLNISIYVPAINYFGDGPTVVTDTWENGWATNTMTINGPGYVYSNIRYDGHVIYVYKAGVQLAGFVMDRDWIDNGAWLQGGYAIVSIKAQHPAANSVRFTSREGTQWLGAASYGGQIEFDAWTHLNVGDWYEYEVYDAGGNLLNKVAGNIGQSHYNQYRLDTRTRITQTVQSIADGTDLYRYAETAESRMQNNYLRNLTLQIGQGSQNSNAIQRQQANNAFGEVIAEIDGRGNRTDLAYNDLGKLVRKEEPTTDVHLATGAPIRARPTTQYYYDELGQLVGTQDPNSSLKPAAEKYYSTRVLVNGRVEREFDAFGNSKQYRYDRLGNERLQTNELGLDTESQYDRNGALTRVTRYNELGVQHSYDSFEYDLAGNRIAHTNALGLRETYLFDSQGRIRRQISFAGRQTRYDYTYLATIGGIGGYETRTITPGLSSQDLQIDQSDYFGKIRYHKDLGGHEFNYFYNLAGWLKEQTGTTGIAGGRSAQHIVYDYYYNGYLKTVNDTGINSYSTFQYDKNGNRTFEAYSQGPLGMGLQNMNPYQLAEAEYDELNRVKRVRDQARFDIHYTYDANNNRRSIESTYFDLLANTQQQQNFYYTYDRMNRFLITMGQRDAAGNIVRGTTGYEVQYDAASQRKRVYSDHPTTSGGAGSTRETYTYDPIGTVRETEILDVTNGAVRRTLRENDAIGRVIDYREFDVNGAQTRWVHHDYDADNLPTLEDTRDSLTPAEVQRTTYSYFANGTLASSVGQTIGAPNAPTVTLTYTYEGWDSYKESVVTISATAANVRGWRPGSSTYAYDSNGHIAHVFDSQASRNLDYINNHQGQVLKRHDVDITNVTHPVIRHFYSLNGVVIGDVGTDNVPSRVDYAQALADYDRRTMENYVKRNGDSRAIGTVQVGRFRVTQYESVTQSVTQSRDIATRVFPVTSADFDQNYQPITDTYPGLTPGSYVTTAGDNLQSVALAMWGDSSLWYILADANGLSGSEQIPAGMRLTVPNVVTNIHNNSQTFRPYDPGLALGDTTPTLPDPPPPPRKKKKCGGLGAILTIIVLVVATIYTAGAAAGYFASMGGALGGAAGGAAAAAGAVGATAATTFSAGLAVFAGTSGLGLAGAVAAAAVGGAVGSIASQAFGMAIGEQDKFSWRQVAMSAVGSAVSAGVSYGFVQAAGGASAVAANPPNGWQVAGQAAVGNMATQGVNMALGWQQKFNWRSVAASAIAAPIARQLGAGATANFGDRLLSAVAGGVVGYAAQRAVGMKNKFDYTSIAANAIGQSLVGELSREDAGLGGGLRVPKSVADDWGPRFALERDAPSWRGADYSLASGGTSLRLSAMSDDAAHTPTPAMPPASDYAPTGRWITVQNGDALERIAGNREMFGAMIVANGLSDPNRLTPGQQLFAPNPGEYDREHALQAANDFYRRNGAEAAQQAAYDREAKSMLAFANATSGSASPVAPSSTLADRNWARAGAVYDVAAGMVEQAGYSFGVVGTPESRAAWALKTVDGTIEGVKKLVDDPIGVASRWYDDFTGDDPEKIRNSTGEGLGVVAGLVSGKVVGRLTSPRLGPVAGAVSFMDDGDKFLLNASKRLDVDPGGVFDVIAHGTPQQIQLRTPSGTKLVDHRAAAQAIENSPGYNGQNVRLLACDAGQCDAGFAQNLANKLGVEVSAPTERVWAYPDGRLVVAGTKMVGKTEAPDLSKPGTFRTFKPMKPPGVQ